MCLFVCVCVSAPQAIKTIPVNEVIIANQTSPTADMMGMALVMKCIVNSCQRRVLYCCLFHSARRF